MPGARAGMPYKDTAMSKFLTRTIEHPSFSKSQRDIAVEVGYEKPNMISMFKRGEAKVPLEKIPALARALGVDLGHMMRIGLEQYWPGQSSVINEAFGKVLTPNEVEIVDYIRKVSKESDPKLTPAFKRGIKEIFAAAEA